MSPISYAVVDAAPAAAAAGENPVNDNPNAPKSPAIEANVK
jgi:hypothetical protein